MACTSVAVSQEAARFRIVCGVESLMVWKECVIAGCLASRGPVRCHRADRIEGSPFGVAGWTEYHFGKYILHFVKHDEAENARAIDLDREVLLMLLSFPEDLRESHNIAKSVAPFGMLVSWDDRCLACVFAKVYLNDISKIPASIKLNVGLPLKGKSWTVPCYVLKSNNLRNEMPEEEGFVTIGLLHPLPHQAPYYDGPTPAGSHVGPVNSNAGGSALAGNQGSQRAGTMADDETLPANNDELDEMVSPLNFDDRYVPLGLEMDSSLKKDLVPKVKSIAVVINNEPADVMINDASATNSAAEQAFAWIPKSVAPNKEDTPSRVELENLDDEEISADQFTPRKRREVKVREQLDDRFLSRSKRSRATKLGSQDSTEASKGANAFGIDTCTSKHRSLLHLTCHKTWWRELPQQ